MRSPASLLHSSTASSDLSSSPSPQDPGISIDSDMVVILASLLCALICVAGLAFVARCACRRTATSSDSSSSPLPPPPKGLDKKAIDALPTMSFASGPALAAECVICLAEFAEGEELRVLPRCGHGFHVVCVDTWIRAHATCPSCRACIAPAPPAGIPAAPGRCRRCGASCDDVAVEVGGSNGTGGGDERFLP